MAGGKIPKACSRDKLSSTGGEDSVGRLFSRVWCRMEEEEEEEESGGAS